MEDFSKLKRDDKDFYTYLKLNSLRNKNAITPEDLSLIEGIVSREKRSKELEDLYIKVVNKEKTINDYTSKYEQYKNELEASIKEALTEKKELSDKSKKIIEYFKLEIKRVDSPLSEEENKKLEELRNSIQEVRTLEEAHKRVNNNDIKTDVLRSLREKYKRAVINEIKKLNLDEKDYIPDDTPVYAELDKHEKKEIPKEVTKASVGATSSLNEIKPVFDIKKHDEIKEKDDEQEENLYDDIVKKQNKKDDNDELDRLVKENELLNEKIDLLKTKIDYLEEQLAAYRSGKNNQDGEIPKEFRELESYFELDEKRENNTITDEELDELRSYTKGDNKMINEIENVVRMKANGELSIKEYNLEHKEVYDKYKEMLEDVLSKIKTK